MKLLLTFLKSLSSLKITVVGLFWLFVLTLWGTVAQVDQGLFAAQERYFNSLIFLVWGFIPCPGGLLTLWVLFINLAAVTITRFSKYRNKRYAGILIIHFGMILYFVSAFVIFVLAKESNVHIAEGASTNLSQSYHEWELAFWTSPDRPREITAINVSRINSGETIVLPDSDVQVTFDQILFNSVAYRRAPENKQVDWTNSSGIQWLEPAPVNKEREQNIAAVVVQVNNDSHPIMFYGGDEQSTQLTVNDQTYFVQLRRKKTELPFQIMLKDVIAEHHPGTQIARRYESYAQIDFQGVKRDVHIKMNEPFRFKDYTLFQASYAIDNTGLEYSTFATVQNSGRLLPYIASTVVFIGLVWHFLTPLFLRRHD